MNKNNRWQQALAIIITIIVVGTGVWYMAGTQTGGDTTIRGRDDSEKLELCLGAAWTDYQTDQALACDSLNLEKDCEIPYPEVRELFEEYQEKQDQCTDAYPAAAKQKADDYVESCLARIEANSADISEDNLKAAYLKMGYAHCFEGYKSSRQN